MKLFLDIETYSPVDLPKAGVYAYAAHPDFMILMNAWGHDKQNIRVDTQIDMIHDVVTTAIGNSDIIVAHNAQFERVCFSSSLGMRPGKYLNPEQFHDTQAVAAEYGYPTHLAALAKVLGGEQKDEAGTRLINLFSKPNRKGVRNLPQDHPEQWQEFINYCRQDVATLIDVDERLGDFPTEMERKVFLADQRINDRGIAIDTQMAELAVVAAGHNRLEQEIRVMDLTGVQNPGSQPQFLKWCRDNISPRISNLQAETIERLLRSPKLKPEHREVLELRQELALVASKKYATALQSVNEDGRLRGTLKFFGAHTGRWSGKGTQIQNLPREQFKDEKGEWDPIAQEAAILDLLLGNGASALDLKKLVRPMFQVNGAVVDFAAIEARVIAWLAGEQWALDAFEAGRDIYVETATRMSTPDRPLTRAHGKVAVLALGFQGAVNSLRVMGAEGEDEELAILVRQWRAANPRIVRLWASLQNALEDAGAKPTPVGQHLAVSRVGRTVRLHLPSGRAIHYHNMKWERYRIQDKTTKRWIVKEGYRYDDPKKPGFRIGTYGGRLAENVTQGVARDLLGEALVRLEEYGFQVIGHVHDEVLNEGPQTVETMKRIMCEQPEWAAGLPIDGAGYTTDRYRKD